jgi:hypothetical protein
VFGLLSIHAAKHVNLVLKWLVDLTRLLAVEQVNWDRLRAMTAALRCRKMLALVCKALSQVFGADVPADVAARGRLGLWRWGGLVEGGESGRSTFYVRQFLLPDSPLSGIAFAGRRLLLKALRRPVCTSEVGL